MTFPKSGFSERRKEKEKGRDGERDEGRKKVSSLFLRAVLLLLAPPFALLNLRPSWVVHV